MKTITLTHQELKQGAALIALATFIVTVTAINTLWGYDARKQAAAWQDKVDQTALHSMMDGPQVELLPPPVL